MPRRAYRAVVRVVWKLRRPWVRQQLSRTRYERYLDTRLTIPPGVHNPIVFRAGAFLAQTLQDHLRAVNRSVERQRPRLLDLGSGSGLGSIVAARIGYEVTAVDISRAAVRCSQANVQANGCADHANVIAGDLFEPFRDRSFDLVVFNPPFFTGTPGRVVDAAWRSSDTLERFAAGFPRIIRPGGSALVVFSSDGDEPRWFRALSSHGLDVEEFTWKDLGNEILTTYLVRRANA